MCHELKSKTSCNVFKVTDFHIKLVIKLSNTFLKCVLWLACGKDSTFAALPPFSSTVAAAASLYWKCAVSWKNSPADHFLHSSHF